MLRGGSFNNNERNVRAANRNNNIDFLLFADNTATLWSWLDAIVRRLQRLRLTLHPGAHPRPVTEGIPFLGFVVGPENRRLKRRKGVHFVRKLRRLAGDYEQRRCRLEHVRVSVQGWLNHARYGNTVGLRKKILRAAVFRRGSLTVHARLPTQQGR